MKILVTSIVDLKKSQHNRPHQIIKYLSQNHDVTVLSINDWWKGEQDNSEEYSKDFHDIFQRIKYYYLTEKRISPIIQELFFKTQIRELSSQHFDVHFNYNSLVTGYEVSKCFKTVLDLADDLSAMISCSPQIPGIFRPCGCLVGEYFIRKNIESAHAISVTTKELVSSRNIDDKKIQVISNGVDTSLFKNYQNARTELGLEGFILGYVGVLREWVDLESVFRALESLDKNIKMLVVGKEGRYQENIELAKKIGVLDRVIFKGSVPYSQVPKYMSAMDICLIPFKLNAISLGALPLKLFEYMACAKPVISVELPAVKKTAQDRVLYVNSINNYSECIELLRNNENLRNQMGIEGREFVTNYYDWSKIANRLESLLLETAER